jgi:shikimate dehydrogenase
VELAFASNTAVINATSTILSDAAENYPLDRSPRGSVVMHMTYKPLHPPFLEAAARRHLTVVDGLEMLIRQAIPSFEAFYGQAPDPTVDVRGLALRALEARP